MRTGCHAPLSPCPRLSNDSHCIYTDWKSTPEVGYIKGQKGQGLTGHAGFHTSGRERQVFKGSAAYSGVCDRGHLGVERAVYVSVHALRTYGTRWPVCSGSCWGSGCLSCVTPTAASAGWIWAHMPGSGAMQGTAVRPALASGPSAGVGGALTGTRPTTRRQSAESTRQRRLRQPGSRPRRRAAARCAPPPCTCLQQSGWWCGWGGGGSGALVSRMCKAAGHLADSGHKRRTLSLCRFTTTAQKQRSFVRTSDGLPQPLHQLRHQRLVAFLQPRRLFGVVMG